MENIYTNTMLFSIATFTLSTVLSPGPNNIMLLSSGLTFGYKKTIPHILGVALGFPFMVIIIGLGLGVVFDSYPIIFIILKYIGILYLFWMAYKIANNKSTLNTNDKFKPFTFIQSAIFQWLNPKAWLMAITSISVFVTSANYSTKQVFIISFIYLLSGIISTNTWTLGGIMLKKFITNEKMVRIFNIIMAILLIVSVLPLIF
jgi:threonine/homoserine/homoserine lactone efflux protein